MACLLLSGVFSLKLEAQARGADKIADDVDAVFVGEVVSGQTAGNSANYVLLVSRTIKGSLLPNDHANVSWTIPYRSGGDFKGAYGMWFLRQAGPGQFNLVQPFNGIQYLPISKTSSPSAIALPAGVAAQPATVGDQIAAEMFAALHAHPDRSQIAALGQMFLAADATPFVRALYGVLRADPDPELKFTGLTGMLRLSDPTALPEIANNLNLIPGLAIRPMVLSAVESRRDSTPEAIQTFGKFASSQDPDLQYTGGDVLRGIHTRDSLPFLVSLLDSPRPQTRLLALIGLCGFVNNLPIETPYNVPNGRANIPQGPTPYRTAETDRHCLGGIRPDQASDPESLQFWKSWWIANKAKLTH
ncbi:MAG TPA: hypothetical protein VKX45_17270 [Bryobacteraceae bacterium]|nr:hypothetical protein [Bryobacteraceae bacterium]